MRKVRLLLLPLLLLLVASAVPPLVPPAFASACHGWTTCPNPSSCGSWSTFYDCDAPFCGWDSYCEIKTGGDAWVQPREKFRACFLQDGSTCYEYQVYSFRLHCGC